MRRCVRCGGTAVDDDWRCEQCGNSPLIHENVLLFAPEVAFESDAFDSQAFGSLADLEAGSFWFRARNALIRMMLKRYFAELRSFLELGCGTGFILATVREAFPKAAIWGTEMLAAGLPWAKARIPSASLIQGDGRNLPFIEEFDVIGAFDVLEHVQEDVAVLGEIFRSVRRGGGLILTVPQHPWLWSRADEFAHHKRRYSRRELVEKVTLAGFKILRLTSFVSLLMPVLVTSRLQSRLVRKARDPWVEFQLPPIIDRTFERVMSVERWLIGHGISFGVGGSLLLVARKPLGVSL